MFRFLLANDSRSSSLDAMPDDTVALLDEARCQELGSFLADRSSTRRRRDTSTESSSGAVFGTTQVSLLQASVATLGEVVA